MWVPPEVNQAEGRGVQFWGGGGREGEQPQKQEHPLQNLP